MASGLTFGDIMQTYQEETGDKQTDARVLAGWLYEAENVVSQRYGQVKESNIECTDKNIGYPLPPDLVEMIEVKLNGEHYYDYEITETGNIFFDKTGTFSLHYHGVSPKIDYTDTGAYPACHVLFHAWLPTYLVGKYWHTTSEGISGEVRMAAGYFQTFYDMVESIANKLKRRAYRPRHARVRGN